MEVCITHSFPKYPSSYPSIAVLITTLSIIKTNGKRILFEVLTRRWMVFVRPWPIRRAVECGLPRLCDTSTSVCSLALASFKGEHGLKSAALLCPRKTTQSLPDRLHWFFFGDIGSVALLCSLITANILPLHFRVITSPF